MSGKRPSSDSEMSDRLEDQTMQGESSRRDVSSAAARLKGVKRRTEEEPSASYSGRTGSPSKRFSAPDRLEGQAMQGESSRRDVRPAAARLEVGVKRRTEEDPSESYSGRTGSPSKRQRCYSLSLESPKTEQNEPSSASKSLSGSDGELSRKPPPEITFTSASSSPVTPERSESASMDIGAPQTDETSPEEKLKRLSIE